MTEETNQTTFADLGLPGYQLVVLDELGFNHPTPIQQAAIPPLLAAQDVVGIAQTGTGKTAAFGLPLLGRVNGNQKGVAALVLAPTRELALQTTEALETLAGPKSKIRMVTVYGGSSYGPQLRALREGAQVVVGTPGRLMDLIEKGALDLTSVNTVVLDEADEMLRMGFAEDVETILKTVPDERLTALFSATMPKTIERVAAKHLTDPQRIEVTSAASTVKTIHQTYSLVQANLRTEALARVLEMRGNHEGREGGAAIVFVRTRRDAEEIPLALMSRGIRASGISGDIAQRERERLVQGLRNGDLDVLVATDVAARGLDVERIGLVVNYEPPIEPEIYVHRIGRTGRAGRAGRSLTFFTPRDRRRLHQIERTTGAKLQQVPIPTSQEIIDTRARRVLEALLADDGATTRPDTSAIDAALNAAEAAGLDFRQIAANLLYEAAVPTTMQNASESARERMDANFNRAEAFDGGAAGASRSKKVRGSLQNRYRLEVGKRDGVSPKAIVGAMTGEAGLRGADLGKINIYPNFSVVEVAEKLTDHQIQKLTRAQVSGRRLKISVDDGPRQERSYEGGRGGRGSERSFDRKERSPERRGAKKSGRPRH